jgi:hypothetical protein
VTLLFGRCLRHGNSVADGSRGLPLRPRPSTVQYPLRWSVSVRVYACFGRTGYPTHTRRSRPGSSSTARHHCCAPGLSFLPGSFPCHTRACVRARGRTNNHEDPARPRHHYSTCLTPLPPSLSLYLSFPHARLATAAAHRAASSPPPPPPPSEPRERLLPEGRGRARILPSDGAVRGGGADRPGRLRLRLPRPPQGRAQEVTISPLFSLVVADSLLLCFLDACSAPVPDPSLSVALLATAAAPAQVRHEEDPPLQAERQVPADRLPGGNITVTQPKPFSDSFTHDPPHSSTEQSRSTCLAGPCPCGLHLHMHPA